MLTPLDISEKEFRRSIRGYSEEEVDSFLDRVVKDYELLYKENLRLKQQLAEMEESLTHYRNLEETLNKTLLLAQGTAEEVRKNAEKEAEMLYKEAKLEGEKMIARAREELARIGEEQRQLEQQAKTFKARLKATLISQLNMLEEDGHGSESETEE